MEKTQSIERPTTSQGERRIAKTFLYYAAFIALGMSTGSFGPTLPSLADHTRTHLSEVSFLFTARSLGYFLGSLAAGRLYDRHRGHYILVFGLSLVVLMLLLVPILPLLAVLTIALATLGFAESFVDVGGNTMLVWVHREKVSPFMNGLHFFFGVGSFLSPVIIAQAVLLSGDITWAYWALALLTVPVILLALRQPSPVAVPPSAHPMGGRAPYKLVALIVLFFFLYVSAEVGYSGWIFTYTVKLNLADVTTAAYLTSTFWIALTAGRLLSVPVGARVSPRTVLAFDLAGCVVSILPALLLPDSLTALWVTTIGLGLSMASIFPTILSFAESRMHLTGQINGWFFAGAAAGGMFLPWLIGQLFEPVGPHVVMLAVAVSVILTLVLYVVLVLYTRRPVVRAVPLAGEEVRTQYESVK
jgi:FHS family Na+ dependent glucose MFS transporter 1